MKKILLLSLAGLLVFAGAAFAQTGTLAGTVVDADGQPVEGARVSIVHDGTCVSVLSNSYGEYVIEGVPVGVYTVNAGLEGVGHGTAEGVEVFDGQVTTVPAIVLVGDGPRGPRGPRG